MIDLNDIQTKQNLIEDIIHENDGPAITNFICTLVAESLGKIKFSSIDLFLLESHISALINSKEKNEA